MIETWILIGVVLVAEGTMVALLYRLYRTVSGPVARLAADPLGAALVALDQVMSDPARRAEMEVRLKWLGRQVASGAITYVREQAGKQEGGAGRGGIGGGVLGMIGKGILGKHAGFLDLLGGFGGGGGGGALPDPAMPALSAGRRGSR